MKHLAQRIFSAHKALLGAGLAFALAAAVTTAPASAQRLQTNKGGSQWEVGVSKESRSGGASVRIGSQGVSLDLHSRARSSQRGAARIPRGYAGGCYEYRTERTWVAGYNRQVWVEPVYNYHYDNCGVRHQILVQAGYYRNVCVPGRYENRQVKVWVPARRVNLRGRDHRHDSGRYQGSRSPIRSHRVSYRR